MTDTEKMDLIISKLSTIENNMVTKKDLKVSENMIFSEMDRLYNISVQQFDKINNKLEIMQSEINTTRYSNETVELLLRKVTELEKRISDIERTA